MNIRGVVFSGLNTLYSKASTYPEMTGRVSDSPCEVAASIRLELVSWLDGFDA